MALAVVSIIAAAVLYLLLRPDPAAIAACINAGGSGSTCPSGATSIAIPALVLVGGIAGAARVWRRR